MTFFKINDRQYIELAPEKQPGSDRLSHYAIETDDAEAMRRYLASKGVAVPDHVSKGRICNLNFMIKALSVTAWKLYSTGRAAGRFRITASTCPRRGSPRA